MLECKIRKDESGVHATIKTDSIREAITAIHGESLQKRLALLIAAVDLERGKWERADDVNEALESASAILRTIESQGGKNVKL